jgi:hypothetical protein
MDGCARQDPAYRPATGKAPHLLRGFPISGRSVWRAGRVRCSRSGPAAAPPGVPARDVKPHRRGKSAAVRLFERTAAAGAGETPADDSSGSSPSGLRAGLACYPGTSPCQVLQLGHQLRAELPRAAEPESCPYEVSVRDARATPQADRDRYRVPMRIGEQSDDLGAVIHRAGNRAGSETVGARQTRGGACERVAGLCAATTAARRAAGERSARHSDRDELRPRRLGLTPFALLPTCWLEVAPVRSGSTVWDARYATMMTRCPRLLQSVRARTQTRRSHQALESPPTTTDDHAYVPSMTGALTAQA